MRLLFISRFADEFQKLWVEHSQSLRLSVLEAVADDADWEAVRGFVARYGSDLFTVPFLGLSNMRGILARVDSDASAYIMFNNLPRVANAKAFLRLINAT